MLTGPIPTPAVANLTQSMRADAGVVISASHNPFADNGIKIFGPDGFKLPDERGGRDRSAAGRSQARSRSARAGSGVGRAERLDDAFGRYVVYAKSTFPRELTLDGLRIVVDAAHGAAYRVAPACSPSSAPRSRASARKPNGREHQPQLRRPAPRARRRTR